MACGLVIREAISIARTIARQKCCRLACGYTTNAAVELGMGQGNCTANNTRQK